MTGDDVAYWYALGLLEPAERIVVVPSRPSHAPTRKNSPQTAPVPRAALTREEAAASLGMSTDSFERHVQAHVKLLRLGRMVLVPVAELMRFADEMAEKTIP